MSVLAETAFPPLGQCYLWFLLFVSHASCCDPARTEPGQIKGVLKKVKIKKKKEQEKLKSLHALISTIPRPMKGNEFCDNVGLNAAKRNPSRVAACLAAVQGLVGAQCKSHQCSQTPDNPGGDWGCVLALSPSWTAEAASLPCVCNGMEAQ